MLPVPARLGRLPNVLPAWPVALWHVIVVIPGVHIHPDADLTEVACTVHPHRLLFRAGQRWQQQSRQDGNARDHHEQFDEGKRTASAGRHRRGPPARSRIVGGS